MLKLPIGKALDYDGRQYKTIDKGKKKLIISTNYINIKKKPYDSSLLHISHLSTDLVYGITSVPSVEKSLDYLGTDTQQNNKG